MAGMPINFDIPGAQSLNLIDLSELGGGFAEFFCTSLSSALLLKTALDADTKGNYTNNGANSNNNASGTVTTSATFYTSALLQSVRIGGTAFFNVRYKRAYYAGSGTMTATVVTISIGSDNEGAIGTYTGTLANGAVDLQINQSITVPQTDLAIGDRIYFSISVAYNYVNASSGQPHRTEGVIAYSPTGKDYDPGFSFPVVQNSVASTITKVWVPIGFVL
jgi:hypothetical protein